MKNYRYGKFKVRDYSLSWAGIVALLFFTIESIILDLSILFVLFPIVYALVWVWVLLAPHREHFIINNNSILVYKGKKVYTIEIPSEVTIVMSYADICPPLTMRTAIGDPTHILKDRIAVSILKKMPLDIVLATLHRNHVRRYTTSTIQTVFDGHRFIYSFVCDQSLFDKLLANRKCQLIIPESLLDKLLIDSNNIDIHIDMNC